MKEEKFFEEEVFEDEYFDRRRVGLLTEDPFLRQIEEDIFGNA